MSEHIRVDLADGVLTVVLARADKKNAITQAMYAALSEAVERARTDAAVRVVLLKAEGRQLSRAGNDIGDFIAIGSQTRDAVRHVGVPVPEGPGRSGQAAGRGGEGARRRYRA